MSIKTRCPSCRTAVKFPDEAEGRKRPCPECDHVFVIPADGESVEETSARKRSSEPRSRPESRLTTGPGSRRPVLSPPAEDEGRPRRKSRGDADGDEESGGTTAMLIVAGAAVLLLAGGAGVFWLLRSEPASPGPVAPEPVAVADSQPGPAPPRKDGGPQPAPVPPQAIADGGEEFFDLPERREGLGGIAGLGGGPVPPPLPPQGEQPLGMGRMVLSGASMSRVGGRTLFRVNYRVEGVLPPGRYMWVILPARGLGFKQNLTPLQVRGQGTLEGSAIGASPLGGPYRTYVAVERLVPGAGLQEEKVSEVLSFR